ncbi:MAG: helicase HerA-like domain-containing protein, partial [Nanoarchaeota archaeon]
SANTWTNKAPGTSPSGRKDYDIVYDPNTGLIILFGGSTNGAVPNSETWTYNYSANAWTNKAPASSPSARRYHTMVYDNEISKVVLFGGETASTSLNDTWYYDVTENVWSQQNPTMLPSKRNGMAMAYDTFNELTILYGGSAATDGGPFYNETWKFDNVFYSDNGRSNLTYDATSIVKFTNLTIAQSLEASTGITVETRTSEDNIAWTTWSSPISGAGTSVDSNISQASGRFIQIRSNLTTGNAENTPTIYNITIRAVPSTNSSGLYNYGFIPPLLVGTQAIKVAGNYSGIYNENTVNLTVNPNIFFTGNTKANNSYVSANSVYLAVDVAISSFSNISYYLFNNSGLVTNTNYSSPTYNINFTSLNSNERLYYYNATVRDTSGLEKSSETRQILLDTIIPQTTLNISTSNLDMNFEYVNINATSPEVYINNVVINITRPDNVTVNYTSSGNQSINYTPSQIGTYYVRSYTADLAGNLNFSNLLNFSTKNSTSGTLTKSNSNFNVNNISAEYPYIFTVEANLSNTGNSGMYNSNISLIFSANDWSSNETNNKVSCGNISAAGICKKTFKVTIPLGETTDVYTVTINGSWQNAHLNSSSLSQQFSVNVLDNMKIAVSNSTLYKSTYHGQTWGVGNISINNTGNVQTDGGGITYNSSGGNLSSSWVSYSPTSGNFVMSSGQNKNISVLVTPPTGTSPGNYTTNISVFLGSALEQIVPLNIMVPTDYSWTYSHNLQNKNIEPGIINVDLGTIILNNTANIQQEFFSLDNSSLVSITPSGLNNISKQENLSLSVKVSTTEEQEPGYFSVRITLYTTENSTDIRYIYSNFTVLNVPPEISSINITTTTPEVNQQITIQSNITDQQGISFAWINLSLPSGSSTLLNMTNTGGEVYSANYTPTTSGLYTYKIYSNDTKSLSSSSSLLNFTAIAATTINVTPEFLSTVVTDVTSYQNKTLNLGLNLSNIGQAIAYSTSVNWSYPVNWFVSPSSKSFNNITVSNSSTQNFVVTIANGAAPATYSITAVTSWTNPDQTTGSSNKLITINVSSNKILNVTNLINLTVAHNTTNSTTFDISNIGNDDLTNIQINCTSPCNNFTLGFSEIGFNLSSGQTRSITASVAVPYSYSPGNYSLTINASAENNDILTLNITVPYNDSWVITPTSISQASGILSSGDLPTINITPASNVNLSFSVSTTNSSIVTANTSNLFANKNSTKYISLNYTAPGTPGTYEINITLTNASLSVPSRTTTISLNVINFSVNISSINTSNNAGIAAGEKLRIIADATYIGNPLSANITYIVKLNSTSCPITSETYSNSKWYINCTAPSLTDGAYYNVKLIGTFTNFSAAYTDTETNGIYYRDVSSPIIHNTTQNDIVLGQNTNVTANVSDNVNISQVWVSVTYPNLSVTNYTLIWLDNLYYYNLTSLELGDYDLVYFAQDNSSNLINGTAWFEVYTGINFSGTVLSPSNSGVTTTFELYRPNSSTRVYNFTAINGVYSLTGNQIHKRLYDIRIKTSSVEILLKNVTLNESIQDIIDLGILSSSDVTDLPYTPLTGFAVNSNLTNSGIIYINYSGTIFGNENNIYVFRCTDWTYNSSTKTCNSTWTQLNSTKVLANDTIITNITSFSAYMAGEFIPSTSGGSGGGGGGGSSAGSTSSAGGGGGGGGSYKPPVKLNDKSLTIQPLAIDKKLYAGEITSEILNIKNEEETTKELVFSVSENISNFIKITEISSLGPNELKRIPITFTIPIRTEPGDYSGKITISTGSAIYEIPIALTVFIREREYAMNIDLDKSIFSPGNNVKVKIQILNVGNSNTIEGRLKLVLRKDQQNISETTEEVYWENSIFSAERTVNLSENINLGNYVIEGLFIYEDNNRTMITTSSARLELKSKFSIEALLQTEVFNIRVSHILFAILAIISTMVAIYVYNEIQFSRKIYKARLYNKTLPKKSKRAINLGKIAETNKNAYFEIDKLARHTLIAGSTGSGKTVSAQVIIEEALLKGISVIVFDPTAQWTGFLQKCKEKFMLDMYKDFNLDIKDAKAFNGNIRQVTNPRQIIDIKSMMKPGEINVIVINKLESQDSDTIVANTIREVFHSNLEESKELKLMMVYDEVHRLLPKFGGSGQGFIQIERACREFRKWGIGLMLISQVIGDFKSEIKANINTEIQMKTKQEDDLERIGKLYGIDILRSLNSASVGVGLIQNSEYNKGKPYFIHYRPLLHSITRLNDAKIADYDKYNNIIDDLQYQLDQIKEFNIDVFDLELELKLALEKVKTGEFNLVRIYLESLTPKVDKMWQKLKKKPKRFEIKMISEAELKKELEEAKEARKKFEDEQKKAAKLIQPKIEPETKKTENKDNTKNKEETIGNDKQENKKETNNKVTPVESQENSEPEKKERNKNQEDDIENKKEDLAITK